MPVEYAIRSTERFQVVRVVGEKHPTTTEVVAVCETIDHADRVMMALIAAEPGATATVPKPFLKR